MFVVRRPLRILGAAAGLLLSSGLVMSPAMAATITYDFSGTVTSVDTQLASQFNTSQTMSGSMTVNQTDTNTADPARGLYNIQTFLVTIGTYTATMGTSGTVQILDRNVPTSFDSFSAAINSPNGDPVNSLNPTLFGMGLNGPISLFTSDALPNPVPSVGSFTVSNQFQLRFGPIGAPRVLGQLTELTAVPLPAAMILFGAGLVALLGLGARGLRNVHVPQA